MQGVAASVTDTLGNLKPWLQKVTAQTKPTDARYFTTTKKGEIFELKAELNSERREKKKEAVKKVIASMTVGKDVSALFPDVINCMQTDNLELKKLVYLYLMNNAKTQPETAIMAVNTFVKDCDDPNPLIRALAVRTMGCIRVDKITSHLCDPLKKCLKDEDPYVRKTAALCVAKLHDIDSQQVEDNGFLESLRDLLSDSNPMVVANAVAAITEILETTESKAAIRLLTFDEAVVNKLLVALNECTEWGQVFILDAIADYNPRDDREARNIIERVLPRLAHANAAVVLSTVKVIIKALEVVSPNSDFASSIMRKLAPPLVTLLSAEPEIQYVALRNINLIVQKRKDILKQEMKVFFVKYNDPIYVKLEKLDIMIRLINPSNITLVLGELKEYAKEVDVDFVRKAVRAIGRCAIKIESAAERCVSTLLDLIQTKVNYVVQEAVVVIKDIFRKYPNKYESIISTLCENLDTLDEPEARASMIWIVGEYAERIDNADELLESFLDGFQDENTQVQLQLLTAIVKLFLKRPKDTQELVQQVLALATQSDNPDLRDRGFIYWRLLSTDPTAAKEVVLCEKPLISEETDMIEPTLLDELICHIASLASVFYRPPSSFTDGKRFSRRQLPTRSDNAGSGLDDESSDYRRGDTSAPTVIPNQESLIGDLLDLDLGTGPSTYRNHGNHYSHSMVTAPQPDSAGMMDLLGDGLDDLLPSSTTPSAAFKIDESSSINVLQDIFGNVKSNEPSFNPITTFYTPPYTVLLAPEKGNGLEIQGTFFRKSGQIYMSLKFKNNSSMPMFHFAIQFNHNSFGLGVKENALNITSPIQPGQTVDVDLPINTSGKVMKVEPLTNLQVAVKNNVSVFYFSTEVPMHVLFVEEDQMDKRAFLNTWKEIPNQKQYMLGGINANADQCADKLQKNNVFTITKRDVEGQNLLYQYIKLVNGILILVELVIKPNDPNLVLSLKSNFMNVCDHVYLIYEKILKS